MLFLAGGVAVRTLDLRSKVHEFDSRSGCYQVVLTRMADCLWTGELSRYITKHQGQLSLPSLWGRLIEYRSAWLGLRRGAFTCVGWQVTLRDPIWQVTLSSSEIGSHRELYGTAPHLSLDEQHQSADNSARRYLLP